MEFDSLRIGYSSPAPQASTSTPAKGSSVTGESDASVASSAQQYESQVRDGVSLETSQDIRPSKTRDRELSEEEIGKVVAEANKQLRGSFREFSYGVHKKTNTVMIKIINSDTKETIREIPPEKTLDALAKMWELAGIIVDEKK